MTNGITMTNAIIESIVSASETRNLMSAPYPPAIRPCRPSPWPVHSSRRALAQQTRDDFFPKQALQLSEVKGLDVTLKQALEFKYITSPMTVADAQGMLDILYKPEQK